MSTSDNNENLKPAPTKKRKLECDMSTPSTSRQKNEISMGHYLFLKNKRTELQDIFNRDKFEEKKQLKLKEIQAINNLAEAIKGSAVRAKDKFLYQCFEWCY